MADRQYIFPFGAAVGGGETGRTPRLLLGARGARLAELSAARLPTPSGFTVSAEVCAYLDRHQRRWPPRFADELRDRLRSLDGAGGARFGYPARPLLVSVDSGEAGVPPIGNLGLNDRSVPGFATAVGSERAAWDAYRRLLRRYGVIVAGCREADFETARRRLLLKYRAADERALDAACLRELCDLYKRVFFERTGRPFPQDPSEQLRTVLLAAYERWRRDGDGRRAAGARGAPPLGVAVTVCAMAYGHLDGDSAVVRAVSRDPLTGEDRPVGHYLVRAQEDDFETADAAPAPLERLALEPSEMLRHAHAEVLAVLRALERRWHYPHEARFVIESGRLVVTDAAPARRAGRAAVRWAVDMAAERGEPALLTRDEALAGLTAEDIRQFWSEPQPAGGARARSLLEAFRRGARAAGRHPDFELYRTLCEWSLKPGRPAIHAETDDLGGIRMARRLAADGIVFRPAAAAEDAAPRAARERRTAEACRTAARGLPVLIETAGPLSAPPAGIGWLLVSANGAWPDGALSHCRGYLVATPRDALLADRWAEYAELLLLDVPRLTRACRGQSAESADARPEEFDIDGVGQLLETAVRKARSVRHDIAVWARGLAPDDLAGLRFCARAGIVGITVPVEAVPAMRIAAAQAMPRR